ncbi:MAG: VWA domain-containing protein [Blastocatellia bacterium]|nr:VWA domain-containing protein [Blastocatellia bacterium]
MQRIGITVLASLLLVSAMAFVASGQNPKSQDQDEPLKLKADLVMVNAAVLGPGGGAIRSLKLDDFVIYEDGVEQKITHFAATEEPFSIMLLLDISGSTRDEIELIKHAAKKFLAELRKDDRAGVIVFSREIELIADFNDSRAQVEAALDSMNASEGADGYQFTTKTGTSFYDALFLAIDESPLKETEGRKAIVCMSDGVDSTSKIRYGEAARAIEQSEASVYLLNLNTQEAMISGLVRERDDPGYINFSQSQIDKYYDEFDRDSLERHRPRHSISPEVRREIAKGLYAMAEREQRELSERTGGRLYPVNALTDLSKIFKQVADDLRSQYFIGYYPINDKHDGRWRSLRLEVRRRNAKVRTRSGYWAK